MDLSTTTWYNPDYRSCPSGIGFIHKPDGSEILITDEHCGPKNLKEAKEEFRPEYVPTAVEHLPGEFWDFRKDFFEILKKHGVTHVVDYEQHSGTVTLNTYLKGFK
tara:strand:+ start:391 stop:708 length:318 start_codon:yes stop_codon:yes gene_type:complete